MKKSIKRASSLALAMLMAGSIMPMVFAADTEINQDSNPKTGEIKVSYEVKESYKVTFPAEVTISSDFDATKEEKITITASDIAVANGKNLKLSITGHTGDMLILTNEHVVNNVNEEIHVKIGKFGTDYTGDLDEAVEATFSNNIGSDASTFDLGLKLLNADELNGKSAGIYSGNIDIEVTIA